jgi:topoisomerase-4 subunit A
MEDFNIHTTQTHEENVSGEHHVKYISGMYKNWFLDYASYVILERAVPHVIDGLKPVQRRILHSMKRLDDGRYNKVANIIGYTMQYHPHGDASIGDALVQLGQKDLLIDQQGNWGNIFTGDSAAAPRYIEARLSKFAHDVIFNPKTTKWKMSYDGRNKEPINLPVKFPLLLAQGVEGIAVGLASKILPHNFIELIDASISHLKGEQFELFPDFPTGGLVDVSRYQDGSRGGKIRVRAKIEKLDKKTLIIKDLPFGKTTGTLIESILAANEKNKIKVRKIEDNTAEFVEILVHLQPGISPDTTIDALYAVTDCEVSISPNSTVIFDDKPLFPTVSEMLRISVQNTMDLLRMELEIRKNELEEAWHMSSLEKIFIENRIYNSIENCETWESVLETIDKGLKPFKKKLRREVTTDDIVKLTEIKIKRISKYDGFKSDEYIKSIEEEMIQIDFHLAHLVQYTIDYYLNIKEKYGVGKERKTEIRNFENIEATKVVIANEKLYINYEEGFAGMSLKKDTYVSDCSDMDEIIVFRRDGTYFITKVTQKTFVGQNVIHIAVFKKNDKRTIYNAVYRDGKTGFAYMKRFYVKGVTRDKEYNLTQDTPRSEVLYFTANPNGEAETVHITLKPRPRLKKRIWDEDFSKLSIKGRDSMGNILSKNPVHKISLKEEGVSTLGGRKIWFDRVVLRLNADEKGEYLGEFKGDEKLLVITKSGNFRLSNFDLSNHFEDDLIILERYRPGKIFTAVLYDAEQGGVYLKRFNLEPTDKTTSFIGDNAASKLIALSEHKHPIFEIIFGGAYAKRAKETVDAEEFIAVKSYKARGKRLSNYEIQTVVEKEPKIVEGEDYDQEFIDENDSENSIENGEPEFEIIRPGDEGEQTILKI